MYFYTFFWSLDNLMPKNYPMWSGFSSLDLSLKYRTSSSVRVPEISSHLILVLTSVKVRLTIVVPEKNSLCSTKMHEVVSSGPWAAGNHIVSMTFQGLLKGFYQHFRHTICANKVCTVQLYPCSLMTIGKYISIDFRTKCNFNQKNI